MENAVLFATAAAGPNAELTTLRSLLAVFFFVNRWSESCVYRLQAF